MTQNQPLPQPVDQRLPWQKPELQVREIGTHTANTSGRNFDGGAKAKAS